MKASNLCQYPRRLGFGYGRPIPSDPRLPFSSAVEIAEHNMSSALIEMVLPHVSDGIVLCDAAGLIVMANVRAKQLALQDPEGKPVDLVEGIWGKLMDSSGNHLPVEEWPLFKALLGESVSWKECRLIQPNGGAVDILFTPIRSETWRAG
jgi:hypothetical protein